MRQDAIDLYNKLTAEWNKKPQNLEKCNELLSHLKVNYSNHVFFYYEF
jgi:hypothetical protein